MEGLFQYPVEKCKKSKGLYFLTPKTEVQVHTNLWLSSLISCSVIYRSVRTSHTHFQHFVKTVDMQCFVGHRLRSCSYLTGESALNRNVYTTTSGGGHWDEQHRSPPAFLPLPLLRASVGPRPRSSYRLVLLSSLLLHGLLPLHVRPSCWQYNALA